MLPCRNETKVCPSLVSPPVAQPPEQGVLDCSSMAVQFKVHKKAETIVRVKTTLSSVLPSAVAYLHSPSTAVTSPVCVLKEKHLIPWASVCIYLQAPKQKEAFP